jgi:hypothetical protein
VVCKFSRFLLNPVQCIYLSLPVRIPASSQHSRIGRTKDV